MAREWISVWGERGGRRRRRPVPGDFFLGLDFDLFGFVDGDDDDDDDLAFAFVDRCSEVMDLFITRLGVNVCCTSNICEDPDSRCI